ncbi:MAG: penicillin-binding protein 2 [Lachnospiraceae bacterium]|nr:penicillin-binding protein 2 [Lachnospiraceae bacterium]
MCYFFYYVQFKAPTEINSSYNMRQQNLAKKVIRGNIYAADGSILAEQAMNSDNEEVRYYPFKEVFAHAVGYDSHGCAGVEHAANIDLLTSDSPVNEKLQKEMAGVRNYGDNVYTSYDVNLQETAYEALGAYKGAIVVMDAKTAKILAMVSKPDYDPNTVSDNWASISADTEDSPLVNRATQGLYPPGSTFKIVTLLEYLKEHSDDYQDYRFNCKGSITFDDVTVECYHGSVHGNLDLKESFAKSCNSSFANIGMQLNLKKYANTCNELLFNTDLPTDLYYSKSSFTLKSGADTEEIMHTAMGQGNTLMSPLHMAMITQAIANNGVMMKPYEILKKTNYLGTVIESYEPQKVKSIMTENEAKIEQEFMEEVVNTGTGKKLSKLAYTAAGKTGSAEFGNVKGQSHAWFTGYSNISDPDIVVTVIVEGAGSGSDYAVPMAKRIFDAYYGE